MKITGSTGVLACVVFSLAAPLLDAATLPRKSSEFAILMTDGTQLRLSSYREKHQPVVLAFILTTCPDCQAFTQLLSKVQTDYAQRGLQVLASAIEEKAKPAVPGFVRAFQPPFPVGYNPEVEAVDFLQHPRTKILHMPTVVFIDRQGNIVAQYEGKDDFMQDADKNVRAKIEELLSTGGPAKKAPPTKSAAPGTKK